MCSWWSPLAGAVGCLLLALLVSWWITVLTLLLLAGLAVYATRCVFTFHTSVSISIHVCVVADAHAHPHDVSRATAMQMIPCTHVFTLYFRFGAR